MKFLIYGHYVNDKLFYIGSNWLKGDENRPYDFKYRVPYWFEYIYSNGYSLDDVQVKILEVIEDDVNEKSKATLKRENELILENKHLVINKIFSETVSNGIANEIGRKAAITRKNTILENGLNIDENNGKKIQKIKNEKINGVSRAKIAYEKSREKRNQIQENGKTGYQNHAEKTAQTMKNTIDEETGLTLAQLRAKKAALTASERTYTKVCKVCNREFEGNYRSKYCGSECRKINYYNKYRKAKGE